MADTFLDGILVVELGDRTAVAACGSLLGELGAMVVLAETRAGKATPDTKWERRAGTAAGKRSIAFDANSRDDAALLQELIRAADIVITSSDLQPAYVSAAMRGGANNAIVCDISAFGSDGPLAGRSYPDFLIQALSGAMDTTGAPEGAPTPTAIPIMEMAAGAYATAGALAALRVRRIQGIAQQVEVALFDCAVSMLTTFLPGYFTGREPQRIGNHHPSMSPWNAFRASDGWVLMCSGSDDQWRRVCELMGCDDLVSDQRYASPTLRMQVNAEVDALVEKWTQQRTVAECIDRFNSNGLACGPVYSMSDLFEDPSLRHRGMIRALTDPVTGKEIRIPGRVFRGTACDGRAAAAIPNSDQDRDYVKSLLQKCAALRRSAGAGKPANALEGVRVIEIGNYTTAPLAARQLAALGADVVKLEPPVGDASRALPPHRNGQGYFFTMSNSGKRSLELDLRRDEAKARFRELLAGADVLVENLRPGSLAKLGFSAQEILKINPRLVYCPISGFGADSPYADRAAMDTTIQAMSGVMDLTRADGVPYKTGISSADLTGGQFGLVAILAALEYRDRGGRGQSIDLSMQDGAAWLTQLAWNEAVANSAHATLIRCSDGYAAAQAPAVRIMRELGIAIAQEGTTPLVVARDMQRANVVDRLERSNIPCAPVLRVTEVAAHAQTRDRQLIVTGRAADGTEWPLLTCPVRLSATPCVVKRAIGALGADNDDVFQSWLRPGEMPCAPAGQQTA